VAQSHKVFLCLDLKLTLDEAPWRTRHTRNVTAAAPRYDPRILAAVRRLDDEHAPIAETCRRVGEFATALGLPRPSYVHLRRIVKADRELRRARREMASEIVSDLGAGLAPRLARAIEQARAAEARAARLRES
jgi:hypothetical protein